jgi:hypothetical protein
MRLVMHVVLEEIKAGDWLAGGNQITPERVRAIAPNIWRTPRTKRAAPARTGAAPRRRRKP